MTALIGRYPLATAIIGVLAAVVIGLALALVLQEEPMTCAELDARGDRQYEEGDYAGLQDTLEEWTEQGCLDELFVEE